MSAISQEGHPTICVVLDPLISIGAAQFDVCGD